MVMLALFVRPRLRHSSAAALVSVLLSCAALAFALIPARPAVAQAFRSSLLGDAALDTSMASSWLVPTALGNGGNVLAPSSGVGPNGSTVPEVAHPILLAEPYACIPNAERLFTQSELELTSVEPEEFVTLTGLDFERYAQLSPKEREKNQRQLTEGLSQWMKELRNGTISGFLPAPQEGSDLFFWACLLLHSADAELRSMGFVLLDHCTVADPRNPECSLQWGRVALKERRWVEARMHLSAALTLSESFVRLVPEAQRELQREACFGLVVANEQLGNYPAALSEVESLLKFDPHDWKALLHKGAILFLQAPGDLRRREECLNLFAAAHEHSPTIGDGAALRHTVPPAELTLIDLLAHVVRSDEALELWKKVGAEPHEQPAEALRTYLTAARWHLQFGKHDIAERFLQLAHEVDAAAAARSEVSLQMRFLLNQDTEAREALSSAYLDDPSNARIGRMLALVLLESTDMVERLRGERIARFLLKNSPDSKSLKIVVAYARFNAGREEEAYAMIKPVLPPAHHYAFRYGGYYSQPTIQGSGIPVVESETKLEVERLLRVYRASRRLDKKIVDARDLLQPVRLDRPSSPILSERTLVITGRHDITEFVRRADDEFYSSDDVYLMARILAVAESAKLESPTGEQQAKDFLRLIVRSSGRYQERAAALFAALEEIDRRK